MATSTTIFGVSMPTALLRRLDRFGVKVERSRSSVIRRAVTAYLAAHEHDADGTDNGTEQG
jgi:metal-responsive CopG/Arc/MetJ family transcriptional regulator